MVVHCADDPASAWRGRRRPLTFAVAIRCWNSCRMGSQRRWCRSAHRWWMWLPRCSPAAAALRDGEQCCWCC